MSNSAILNTINAQKAFFKTGATKDIAYRIKYLKALQTEILSRHDDICEAVHKDLNKSTPEVYLTELATVKSELNKSIKKIPKWTKPKKVKTPLAFKPAYSQIRPEPYGNTLIIGPWNFPFSLLIQPMIGALAAGNTVLCKPSEHAPHTAKLCKEIIEKVFEPQYVACIEGGIPETTEILNEPWDYIFFTGSTHVGRIVYQAAAKYLTPVTLELGGKSPCIIDKSANLDTTASRIVYGKFLNSGQVCIAPDYLLIEESVKDELLEKIKTNIVKFYGENAQESNDYGRDYGRIINERNFDRLVSLIDKDKVIFGGQSDRSDKFISPTIMDNITRDDKAMKEEIFGPILPIITWKQIDEVKQFINEGDKPLVLYVYSKNKANIEDVLNSCSSGGAVVNDCLLQNANKNLPFGGVGASGIGAYNGDFTFQTFSHMKGEVHKASSIDPDIRYPPLKGKFKTLKWIADNLL